LFNGREFTASVWVKTNHPSVRFYLYDGSNTDQGKKTAIADGEWHYLQETFTFDATAGTKFSIEVIILSEAGGNTSITSGDYVEFTGLQVELGKVATPFEHRSYGEELALASRYFERKHYEYGAMLNTTNWTSTDAYGGFEYTTKRATPTGTVSSLSDFNHYSGGTGRALTGLVVQAEGIQSGTIRVITGGALTLYQSSWIEATSGGGYFDIDAEL